MSKRTKAGKKERGDGLYLDPRSPYVQIDKRFAGRRLCRSSRTASFDEAKAQVDAWIAEQRKRLTLEALGVAPVEDVDLELTLDEAVTRYFEEVGCRAKASHQDDARLAWICQNFEPNGLGARTKLSAINENMILALAARRRAAGRLGAVKQWTPCSEYTINRMLDLLRAVMRRALVTWKAPVAVIDWGGIYTPRAKEGHSGREMPASKEAEVFAAMRLDVREPAEFLLIHGIRAGRALMHMQWSHIDFDAGAYGVAKILRKTRLAGDHYYDIPLTARSREILLAQQGRHQKCVWTYVVHRRHVVGNKVYRAGDRRPITKSVLRGQLGRALKEVLGRFRVHDLRHTMARRTLRAGKNLRAVQRALGHADIATTAIYTDVLLEDVHAALEAAESRRVPGASPTNPTQLSETKCKTGT